MSDTKVKFDQMFHAIPVLVDLILPGFDSCSKPKQTAVYDHLTFESYANVFLSFSLQVWSLFSLNSLQRRKHNNFINYF